MSSFFRFVLFYFSTQVFAQDAVSVLDGTLSAFGRLFRTAFSFFKQRALMKDGLLDFSQYKRRERRKAAKLRAELDAYVAFGYPEETWRKCWGKGDEFCERL